MDDRAFIISFGVSMGAHLVVLMAVGIPFGWFKPSAIRWPIEVVYEQEPPQSQRQVSQDQLARDRRSMSPAPSPPGAHERSELHLPERPLLIEAQALAELLPARPSIVDLTNLVDAARGDPVLLGYFSAIRQQIQRSANSRMWVTQPSGEGLVCVSFVLAPSGRIHEVVVVPERSTPSTLLRETALRIVFSAAPFPPFPPSFDESDKTIVVPLEFQFGSSAASD